MVVCLVNRHRTVAFVWGTVRMQDSPLLPRAVPDTAESKHRKKLKLQKSNYI